MRGFSERKKQRRAYGLAMQKVKDRKGRLIERKERKQSLLEQIEQAENAKEELLESVMHEEGRLDPSDNEEDDNPSASKVTPQQEIDATQKQSADTLVQKYSDRETEKRWGGQVIVTTSSTIPGDDDSVDEAAEKLSGGKVNESDGQSRKMKKHKDKAQEFAGSLDRFLSQTSKSLPAKKKKQAQQHGKRSRGKHGAADMKGVGGAAALQTAQKLLKRSKNKPSKRDGKKKGKR